MKLHQRFSLQVLGFAALVALAAGLTFAPARAMGQQATAQDAAAQTATGATNESAEPKSAESKEERQVEIFRLEGPEVKWTARMLHLSIEKTAEIYEAINFLIIVLAIGIPLVRWLPRHLRSHREKVRGDIESARKVTEDANARLSAVEAKLSSLDEEIQKFRAEVETESRQDEARIKASLGEESTRIVQAAEQEIGVAAAQARRGLRLFAADLAIGQAAKKLTLTPEADRALIAEFVGEVVRNGTANGGKN
ncbi:MAG TPA: ATP synthase F0 subunit B [Terracidiphilus sp.]